MAAFEWLDKAADRNVYDVILVYASPFFRNLHGDSRWHTLLERIGRSPEQVAAIDFRVPLPQRGN